MLTLVSGRWDADLSGGAGQDSGCLAGGAHDAAWLAGIV
jgi:hypothetical protein